MRVMRNPVLVRFLESSLDLFHKPSRLGQFQCLSSTIGASIPFFFLRKVEAVTAAAMISLVAHFAVGAAKSIISIRSWQFSGLEVTIVGALEGAVTNSIG